MLAVNVRATETLSGSSAGRCTSAANPGPAPRPRNTASRTTRWPSLIGWRRTPTTPVTKVAATHRCRLAAAQYGQHVVTLRLTSLYGRWEEPGRLMPTLIDRALDGTYPLLVAPSTARDFVWIEDVCDAFVRAATTDLDDRGSVLNVASGVQTTLRSLVEIVKPLFDIESDPVWRSMPARGWDTAVWVGDPSTTADVIGWTAGTSFEHGLRTLAAWMQADPTRRARYVPTTPNAGAIASGSGCVSGSSAP